MMNGRQIPANAMVQSEADSRAFFTISDNLTVTMSNGEGTCLSLRLTPAEARGFAHVFEQLADVAEEMEGLGIRDCAGTA